MASPLRFTLIHLFNGPLVHSLMMRLINAVTTINSDLIRDACLPGGLILHRLFGCWVPSSGHVASLHKQQAWTPLGFYDPLQVSTHRNVKIHRKHRTLTTICFSSTISTMKILPQFRIWIQWALNSMAQSHQTAPNPPLTHTHTHRAYVALGYRRSNSKPTRPGLFKQPANYHTCKSNILIPLNP